MVDPLAKVVKDDNKNVDVSENKSVRILMIYRDVHSGNKRHFDVDIQRISMDIYTKLPHKMRGNNYNSVFLMDDLLLADLEKYPKSMSILRDTLLTSGAEIKTLTV